jgi:hypothetical protein
MMLKMKRRNKKKGLLCLRDSLKAELDSTRD